jgi:hypothetical protein
MEGVLQGSEQATSFLSVVTLGNLFSEVGSYWAKAFVEKISRQRCKDAIYGTNHPHPTRNVLLSSASGHCILNIAVK